MDKINNYSFFKKIQKIFLVKKNYMTYLRTNPNLYFLKSYSGLNPERK